MQHQELHLTLVVPLRFPGLSTIGVMFFILNLVLFVFNCTMMSLRAYYWPKNFKGSFFHPSESLFIPAFFITIATILINICEYGLAHGKAGPWLLQAMVVMFWIYVAISILASAGVYLLMYVSGTCRSHRTVADTVPGGRPRSSQSGP